MIARLIMHQLITYGRTQDTKFQNYHCISSHLIAYRIFACIAYPTIQLDTYLVIFSSPVLMPSSQGCDTPSRLSNSHSTVCDHRLGADDRVPRCADERSIKGLSTIVSSVLFSVIRSSNVDLSVYATICTDSERVWRMTKWGFSSGLEWALRTCPEPGKPTHSVVKRNEMHLLESLTCLLLLNRDRGAFPPSECEY
jgi:hypothetical protein